MVSAINLSAIAALTIVLLTYGITSMPTTIVDDIKIVMLNGTIYCDTLICPPSTYGCRVTKHNNPRDYSQIIRERKCYAINGAVIAKESRNERNTYDGNINLTVVSGGGDPNIVLQQ